MNGLLAFAAALCTAAAVAAALAPSPSHVRLRALHLQPPPSEPTAAPGSGAGEAPSPRLVRPSVRRIVVVAAGAAVAVLVGGPVGIAVGAGVGVALHRWLATLDTAGERLVRDRVASDVPLAADLLAGTLVAGVPLGRAIPVIAAVVGGPLGDRLAAGARAESLGLPPSRAWAPLVEDPGSAHLGRLLALTSAEGTAPATALGAVAEDVRAAARAAAEGRARALGARVAAPLGLCFLPAFLLLGVVPFVASAAAVLVP